MNGNIGFCGEHVGGGGEIIDELETVGCEGITGVVDVVDDALEGSI